MTNEIVKKIAFKRIALRNHEDLIIENEPERVNRLLDQLATGSKGIIILGEKAFNPVDFVALYDCESLEEFEKSKKIKMGYWVCKLGNLHERGKKCNPRQCFLDNDKAYQNIMAALRIHHTKCAVPQEEWLYRGPDWHFCRKTASVKELRDRRLFEAELYEDLDNNY